MRSLIDLIISDDPQVRDQSLDKYCSQLDTKGLLKESIVLDEFRRSTSNLYFKVRALFFLYAVHRFYLPGRNDVGTTSMIPFEAYEHMLKRRFEEAINMFMEIQESKGVNEGVSSGLAEAYYKLAFQTLADQVRKSVRSTQGNQWMFRIGHPQDHPLKVNQELLLKDSQTGLFPVLKESTPVRMDISHSCWSDIFFLGMDFPEGAKVMNISVDLQVWNSKGQSNPIPPINTYFRVIDEPVIRLTSIDLKATTTITKLEDIFDFGKDYLGLVKAAIIASGIVPAGMEGSRMPLKDLLRKLVGEGQGFELVSIVNNIPKGSRLAVSTNLLASLISVCMRATGQMNKVVGQLQENERRLVAARAILGEWIGGSGGGWQDSGGVWPGIKLIQGVKAQKGDPEMGVSKGCLLPQHTILEKDEVDQKVRQKLQDSLVMVHGGMAQDVGPILEMVTEKYLLRSEDEFKARHQAINFFDQLVDKIKAGDIQAIGSFTQQNFEGPIQTIIPWTTNIYTETLIEKVKTEFGEKFWGFWMMGGMSGGGMGFIFDPEYKTKAQLRLQDILSETKQLLQHAVPFAMEPVVYDFAINEKGTYCSLLTEEKAILPVEYYTMITPALLKNEISSLSALRRSEMEMLGKISREVPEYSTFVSGLFDNMLPQASNENIESGSLEELLKAYGFDTEFHQQIKTDLKFGRIGLAQNRLPVNSKIEDVDLSEMVSFKETHNHPLRNKGVEALRSGQLAIVTLAGGVGSRWTKGAGVVKSLNHFSKLSGKHRNFIEVHLAKNRKIANEVGIDIPHVFTTSYLTHNAIKEFLELKENYGHKGTIKLSPGRIVGLRLVPTERELRFMWEKMPQQVLDEQAQKMQDSLRSALINWAKTTGEAEDYTDNVPHQCIHPVGHWYEVPNMFLNGTLRDLLKENPGLKHIFLQNVDTLGANADPAIFAHHIESKSAITVEVITRWIDDRGGGLAKIDGKNRLVEGMALPDEKIEFNLSYYNSNSMWIDIDKILKVFGLNRADLDDHDKVKMCVRQLSSRMPTYITLKDVKKRWGKGQEDVYPVVQFEKLWGDMTSLDDLNCSFVEVPRFRGQQLKEVGQLDGWLRDGSAAYVDKLCEW